MMLSNFDIQHGIAYTGDGKEPTRGTPGASAWDVYANEDVTLYAFSPALVRTGLNIQIPKGHALFVLPRSGNSLKKKIIVANSPGNIDEDYRGELCVILTLVDMPNVHQTMGGTVSLVPAICEIKKGDRIAQVFLTKYEEQRWHKVPKLDETQRGTGGFGSTGQ
jgi:dUTP pyrophosphatase